MKKLFIFLLLFVTVVSCDKELSDLKLSETISGGCFLEKGNSSFNSVSSEVNKVTYSIVNSNLELLFGFNATCCGEYETESEISGDTILVKVSTIQEGQCNCVCYYTYNFIFAGSGYNYKYIVTLDDRLTFTGEIKH
jgi:hypothetical protein